MWRDRWEWHLTDMHGAIGIWQDARKHKERWEECCPRLFAPAAACRASTNIFLHFAQVPLCHSQLSPLNHQLIYGQRQQDAATGGIHRRPSRADGDLLTALGEHARRQRPTCGDEALRRLMERTRQRNHSGIKPRA
jgi:hypothetical protein